MSFYPSNWLGMKITTLHSRPIEVVVAIIKPECGEAMGNPTAMARNASYNML